jgi:hypothetical protein
LISSCAVRTNAPIARSKIDFGTLTPPGSRTETVHDDGQFVDVTNERAAVRQVVAEIQLEKTCETSARESRRPHQHRRRAWMSDALLLSVLSQLEVGETSHVLDTDRGFMVLKRLPLPQGGAVALSMTAIAVPYRADEPTGVNRAALARANALAEARASNASRFHDYCVGVVPPDTCSVETWTRGQGSAALEEALMRVGIGESVARPVPTPFGYYTLRREDPAQHVEPPETLAFRMYREPQPSFVALLERAPSEVAAGLVQAQTREFIARSGMPEPMSAELQRIAQALGAKLIRDRGGDRSTLHARFCDELGKAFGPELVRSYEQFANQRLYALLNY